MASFTAIEQPIPVKVRYCPIVGATAAGSNTSNPGLVKFFKEIQLFFQNVDFDFVTVRFSSDFVPGGPPIDLVPTPVTTGWGQFAWGQVPWGGGTNFQVAAIRTYIPLQARRAHWLNLEIDVNQAMTGFNYGGCVIQYQDKSTRVK